MTNLHKTVSVLTKLITVATNSDVYRLTSGRVPMVCCYASVVNLFLIANPFPTSRNSQPPASFVVWFVGPSTALGLLFATHRSLHLEVGNGRRTSGEPGKLPLVVMRLHVVAVPINGCGSWTNTLMERPFLRLANNPTTRRCLSRSERRGRKHQLIWADDHYSQPEALRWHFINQLLRLDLAARSQHYVDWKQCPTKIPQTADCNIGSKDSPSGADQQPYE